LIHLLKFTGVKLEFCHPDYFYNAIKAGRASDEWQDWWKFVQDFDYVLGSIGAR
jgi:hypothetical protein